MNRRTLGAVVLISGLLLSGTSRADEVLERVVVRNRLHSVAGRLELSPSLGFSLSDTLTNHTTLSGGIAFNVAESFAIEGRATYALTRHTALADRVSSKFLSRDPSFSIRNVDDLENLWEMKWNLMGGLRWAPVYGKLSLVSELPVHYQAYLWVGGGVAGLHRESAVYCLNLSSRDEGTCSEWLTDDRVSPLGSAALGMRFFVGKSGSLKLELRDYVFADAYRVNIDRVAAESGDRTSGTLSTSPGLTHVVVFDIGYAFIF